VEPEDTAFAKQWLGKQLPTTKNKQAKIEELLDAVFPVLSVLYPLLNKRFKESRRRPETIYPPASSSQNLLLNYITETEK
jgi:hypothetical protein